MLHTKTCFIIQLILYKIACFFFFVFLNVNKWSPIPCSKIVHYIVSCGDGKTKTDNPMRSQGSTNNHSWITAVGLSSSPVAQDRRLSFIFLYHYKVNESLQTDVELFLWLLKQNQSQPWAVGLPKSPVLPTGDCVHKTNHSLAAVGLTKSLVSSDRRL